MEICSPSWYTGIQRTLEVWKWRSGRSFMYRVLRFLFTFWREFPIGMHDWRFSCQPDFVYDLDIIESPLVGQPGPFGRLFRFDWSVFRAFYLRFLTRKISHRPQLLLSNNHGKALGLCHSRVSIAKNFHLVSNIVAICDIFFVDSNTEGMLVIVLLSLDYMKKSIR